MRTAILSVLTIVLCLAALSVSAMLGSGINPFLSQDQSFEISVDNEIGTNRYVMIEVDEGDNDEEEMVIETFHEFQFQASADGGLITWDFGDGEVRLAQV